MESGRMGTRGKGPGQGGSGEGVPLTVSVLQLFFLPSTHWLASERAGGAMIFLDRGFAFFLETTEWLLLCFFF